MLSDKQIEQYSRLILLPEIKEDGIIKLLKSKVLIIGCGGLGSSSILYLSANGIGTIGICDFDKVELSNLPRQIVYKYSDINKSKVEAVKLFINNQNPDIILKIHNIKLTQENGKDILKDYDFIIDATDNIKTKYIINKLCILLNKPFVHCGIHSFYANIITILPQETSCFSCIFGNDFPDSNEAIHDKGVFSLTPAIAGSIEASECIKYLIGLKENLLLNTLLKIDLLNNDFRKIKVNKNPSCSVCS